MSIVTITLINKNFQLYSNDDDKSHLQRVAQGLNDKMLDIKLANPSASFELILVLASLASEEELLNLNENSEPNKSVEVKNSEAEKSSETLSTIAKYLENLAKKLGK